MNFFKNLLRSKTIQGILFTVGGALVKFAETSYPQYAIPINVVASAFISGGAVRAIMGRIVAQGPITDDPFPITFPTTSPPSPSPDPSPQPSPSRGEGVL